jgi:hypothetical protein
MLYCREKIYIFADLRKIQVGKSQKVWVHKLKLRRVLKLRNVRKSNKILKSANLRIFDLRNILAHHPPLLNSTNRKIFYMFVVFLYLSTSRVEVGRVTAPPPPHHHHIFPSLFVDILFKDDVMLLLSVSFPGSRI